MLGLVVAFIGSWLALWLVSREHIVALGIMPNIRRLKEFSAGFALMALLCIINFYGQAYFTGVGYAPNPDFTLLKGLLGTFWAARSVLFEELVFRGVILYLLIRKIGVVKACLADALAFGIYHWFSYEMFGGGLISMTYVFLVTGAAGWMFAYAFAKTKSLFAPVGLHFGWVLVSIVVFSAGPLGDQWLIPGSEGPPLGGWATLLFFLWQVLVGPGITTWYLWARYTAPDK